MRAPELVEWRLIAHATEDMYDFRVRRMLERRQMSQSAHYYAVEAKWRSNDVTFRLAEFTTNAPLTDALRDVCINLVRCAS
jgi:hypothetical protein